MDALIVIGLVSISCPVVMIIIGRIIEDTANLILMKDRKSGMILIRDLVFISVLGGLVLILIGLCWMNVDRNKRIIDSTGSVSENVSENVVVDNEIIGVSYDEVSGVRGVSVNEIRIDMKKIKEIRVVYEKGE